MCPAVSPTYRVSPKVVALGGALVPKDPAPPGSGAIRTPSLLPPVGVRTRGGGSRKGSDLSPGNNGGDGKGRWAAAAAPSAVLLGLARFRNYPPRPPPPHPDPPNPTH